MKKNISIAQEMQMTFYCKLVHKGYVQDSFYRDGDSVRDIIEGLSLFVWPEGQWIVVRADEDEDY